MGAVALAVLPCDPSGVTVFHESNAAVRVYQLEAIVHDHTLAIDGPLCRAGPGNFSSIDMARGVDGRPYPNKAPGPVWLALPFYAALAAWLGRPPPLQWAQAWLALLTQALPLLVVAAWWAARSRRPLFAALVGAASPLFVYAGLFQDYAVASALLFAGAALALDSRPRNGVWAGVVLGAAGACNYQVALACAGVAAAVWRWRGGRRALQVVAGATPWVAALAAYHWVAFGGPLQTPYAHLWHVSQRRIAEQAHASWSSLASTLWGAKAGVWYWAPWTALGLAGLAWGARDGRRRPLAAAGLVTWLIAIGFSTYWLTTNGDLEPFNRHVLPVVPFAAAGACWLLEDLRSTTARSAAAALVAGGALVAMVLAVTTAWTYPFHPPGGDVPAPAWSVDVPLWLHGVHLPPRRLSLGAALHPASPPPHWVAAGASAFFVVVALVAGLGSVRPRPWVWVVAPVVAAILAALELGALPPEPNAATQKWMRQAAADVVQSHEIPPGYGWREEGYPDNPWCAMRRPRRTGLR